RRISRSRRMTSAHSPAVEPGSGGGSAVGEGNIPVPKSGVWIELASKPGQPTSLQSSRLRVDSLSQGSTDCADAIPGAGWAIDGRLRAARNLRAAGETDWTGRGRPPINRAEDI